MKNRNILLAITAIAMALVPPPPANQNIGMNDSRFDKLGSSPQLPNQSGCRTCHSAGVPERHHNILSTGEINPVTGSVYGCSNCHPVVTGPNGQSVYLERECLDCHSGLNFSRVDANAINAKVNISRPHHINTAEAAARDCKACHGSFVANTSDGHYVPTYAPSIVTPEPHYKVYNATSNRYWGGCWSCHQNTTANVPVLLSQYETHHGAINGNRTSNQTTDPRYDYQTAGTPGRACNWCHTVTSNGRPVGYPDELNMEFRNASSGTDPVNGTGCENCHDVGTLHNIQVNYQPNGPAGYGHINNNADCNGCHAFWDAGDVSGFEGAMIPDVTSIAPTKLLTSDTATTVTISGASFLSGVGTYTVVVAIDGTTALTPSSVTDTEIVVTVPVLAEGVHSIQVVAKPGAAGGYLSRLGSLVVVKPVTIASAKLSSGAITITGSGFGTIPSQNAEQYVTIAKPDGRIVYSDSITTWGDTSIVTASSAAAVGDLVTVTIAGSATATITTGDVAPSITVTSPNGGENWKRGTTKAITWASVGSTGANVKIELLKGTSVSTIAKSVPNTGTYNWKISSGQATVSTYKIRITSIGTTPLYTDMSDNSFTISR